MKTAFYTLGSAFAIASVIAAYLTYSIMNSAGHAVAVGFKVLS